MAHHVGVRSLYRDGHVRPDGLRRDRLVDFRKRWDCRALWLLLSRNPENRLPVVVPYLGATRDGVSVHGMVRQVRVPIVPGRVLPGNGILSRCSFSLDGSFVRVLGNDRFYQSRVPIHHILSRRSRLLCYSLP